MRERGGTTALLQFSRTMTGTLFVSALGLVVAHAVALRVPELGAATRALAALGVLGLSLLFPRRGRDGKREVVAVVLE